MKITLKQLQVFVLTAKFGSISEAATGCYLSQPAASMSLRQLEQALGVPLFDRVGKRLLLNSGGHTLLPRAIAIIDQATELEFLVANPTNYLSGTIKVGCSLTVGNYLLPAYIAKFKQQHPGVQFNVVMNNTQQIVKQLQSFDLDIALIEGPGSHDANLIYQKWQDDSMVVIGRSNHPLANKRKISYQDLGAFPWALRETGSGTAALIEQHALNKFNLQVEMILAGFEAIKNYVANSHCLSCVSSSTMQGVNQKKIKILPPSPFNFTRSITLAMNKLKYQSTANLQFKNYLLAPDSNLQERLES